MANLVNSQQFNELKAQDTLLVADFSATWCGPCKALAPILDEVGVEMAGKANVVKIDVDESEDLAIEFGIRSVPTVLFFKNGQIVDKFVGVVPKAQIVEKTGSIFLAGSYLVKAAIGENIDNETLGGATTHCEISGVTDYKATDDKDALDRVRRTMAKLADAEKAGFNRIEAHKPLKDPNEIYGILPKLRSEPYDMKDIILRLVDNSEFDEYKEGYGQTILTGYARIEGWAVGIVANQRKVVKTKKGEMQFGGVIYSDSADKATRFIANCNQKKIPLLFLQDVTGFMVGSKSEHGGIIKDGAKLVNAVANSVVPKFTVVIGNSYGAGNYAMCGKAYDPRLIVSWHSGNISVMGGAQAAKVLLQIETANLKKKGEELTPEKEAALFAHIKEQYDEQISPYYAAARLWTDAIIDPLETRQWIAMGIEAANNAPIERAFNLGVIQV